MHRSSKVLKNVSLDRSGSLYISTKSPGPKILELETGPTGRRCRRTDSGLERDESVRFSTLQINSQGVAESPQRRCNFAPGSSGVVPTTLVSHVVEDADRATSIDTVFTSPSNGSPRGPTSHVSEPEAGPSGLASLRGSGKGPELSADARDLVAKARSSGITKAYKSDWKKFSSWCDQRQANPYSCPVDLVVNFLAYLQEMGPNAGLSQTELTLKLAMLLALVCRAREHELHAINPQALSWYNDKAVCHILEMTKTRTQSRPHKSFEILRYEESNKIDPVQCLQSYLNLTASQRESGEQKSHLFLSFASPHHAVKTCSIARWLRIVMADAGIDMSKFKAHSTRAAAVSKVPLSGLSVMEIAKLGDWSNATTFFKFYKKELQVPSSDCTVQDSILSSS